MLFGLMNVRLKLSLRVLAGILFLALSPLSTAQTSASNNGLTVSVPNGYATIAAEDMLVQSVAGPVRWNRNWDGQEWKFNPYWESLSQSWKNLTGSQTADTTGSTIGGTGGSGSTTSSNAGSSGCWVWADEDWSPTITAGVAAAMLPERATPFNRVMSESSVDYAAPVRLSVDYASLCTGTTTSAGTAELEGIRRQSELYLGEGGRYAFSNRAVLEKRTVRAIPAGTAAALDAQLSSGNIALSLATNNKGYRWTHKDGNWIDYNTQGQVVAYGDKNDNTTWLARDTTGVVRGVLDGSGRVLYTLHYTGKLLTEVRDAPVASNALDLPRRSVKYQYDANNRLSQVTDVRGNTIKYEYDALNHITKITDQEGRIEQIAYKGSTVSKRTAPDGGVTDYVFEYDDTNKQFISKITGPETAAGRRVEDYTHNRVGKLVREIVNGQIDTEIRYDTGARAEIQTNARGFTTRLTRNEFDQVVQTDQPDGTTRKNSYSVLNLQLTEETDEEGFKTQYQYDSKGNLVKKIEATGTPDERITEYQVNSLGQMVRMIRKGRTEINGATTLDATWQIEYDSLGQISKTIDPEGNVQQYVYNRASKLVRYTDGGTNSTRYEVDAQGNLIRTTDAIGRVRNYAYDKVGNLTTYTDARGKATLASYDTMNRRTQMTNAVSGQYKVQYNGQGLPVLVTDQDGRSKQMEYDNFLRITKQIDAMGNAVQFGYQIADGSAGGQIGSLWEPTETVYPTFIQQTRFNEREYPISRTIKNTNSIGQESLTNASVLDKRGLVKTETDANSNVNTYRYDALGQHIETTDALGSKTSFSYDARGNLLRVVNAKDGVYKFEYDLNDRVTKQILPLGQVSQFNYDAAGNLVENVDPNHNKFTYTYDTVNRLSEAKKTKADGALLRTTTFTWDANSNLIAWRDIDEMGQQASSGIATFDDDNRKTGETINYPNPQGGTFSLSYSRTLSLAGKTTRLIWPDGTNIDYDWSVHGELASVTIPGEGTISVNQFKWMVPEKITLPGGGAQNKTYDGLLNLEGIKVKTPGQQTTLDLNNRYGKVQELKQRDRTDTIGSATSTKSNSYMYDAETRLTQAVSDSGGLFGTDTESFTLDLVGNRLAHSRQSGAWTYDANNRLIKRGDGACGATGTVCYDYDEAGNQTKKTEGTKITQYAYDAMNRLNEVKDGQNNLIARYGYDPQSRRIWKEQYRDQAGSSLAQALRTYYLYADEGLIAEATQAIILSVGNTVAASESPQITTQYGPRPDNQFTTGTLFIKTKNSNGQDSFAYYHHDHLSTPIQATDKEGNVVWAAEYTPFGKSRIITPAPTAERPTINSNLRFPGQYEDAETGLHYNYFRYYDVDTGRYIQSDPIGLSGGVNTYAYVEGNPINMSDAIGLMGSRGNPTNHLPKNEGNKGGQNCVGNECQQSYLDCLANCIRANDPLGDGGKLGATAVGGTMPKKWIGLPRGLGGASSLTTVPSAVAHASGGGAAGTLGALLRGMGRIFSPAWIGYGLYLAGMEVYCATSCANNRCAH